MAAADLSCRGPERALDCVRRLRREVAACAAQMSLAVDVAVYERAGRDPHRPILAAGNLGADICILGRDLGRDEVRLGQPLIGPSGAAVRRGVVAAFAPGSALDAALEQVLLANVVPYKPPDNRPFPRAVREAFRPYTERLLGRCFRGRFVLPLGADALAWFAPYCQPGETRALWSSDDRFERALSCRILGRRLILWPLPHPSPANVRWAERFERLLCRRLRRLANQ